MKGDFLGFEFNGVHSSDLGIVRVSDGSRYNENLLPTLQDRTVQVPGGDGYYYFGSNYTTKQFSISFSFDNMTETQFRKLKEVFGTKDLGKLIFDEVPYKYYMTKITNAPSIKYICFDNELENEDEVELYKVGEEVHSGRIYKGEGTVQFTAYYPYAKSVWLSKAEIGTVDNIDDWFEASRLPASAPKTSGISISGFNAGDLAADWVAFYPVTDTPTSIEVKNSASTTESFLTFDTITAKGNDTYISVNSKTNLIEGWTGTFGSLVRSGNLYNGYLTSGFFSGLPVGDFTFVSSSSCSKLEYQYIYY